MAKSDPTKDPAFQQVVKTFLSTPPKRHNEMKLGKPGRKKSKKPAPKRKEQKTRS
ncbi:MAG TPA: hypothetical protein VFB63_14665 [Bryobacteraceae bacterium]|nr:hypothetical protein [Bryobacteraceae bacterium]